MTAPAFARACRGEGAVKSDGCEQVDIQDILPILIVKRLEAARLGVRGPQVVHQDVNPAPLAFNTISYWATPESVPRSAFTNRRARQFGRSSRSGCNQGAAHLKALHGGGADAPGSSRDQDSLALELLR